MSSPARSSACRAVSDPGVRRARLRGAAGQPARQQRLRQDVPLRQLEGLGRRRLPRHHERRRSRDRDGRRRSGSARHHGLELRRLHDVVGHHADQALQGGLGRRRRHQPHELHRHGGHSRLRAGLLRRRILGRLRPLARALRDVQHQGGDDADADSARRGRRARAALAGLRALQRAHAPEGARRRWWSIRASRTASPSRR